MGWLVTELVALGGPAYLFLQIIMAARYRGPWRLAAMAPLLVMLPLAVEAVLALRAGVPWWPTPLVVVSPVACLYLLLLALGKGWMESRESPRRQ